MSPKRAPAIDSFDSSSSNSYDADDGTKSMDKSRLSVKSIKQKHFEDNEGNSVMGDYISPAVNREPMSASELTKATSRKMSRMIKSTRKEMVSDHIVGKSTPKTSLEQTNASLARRMAGMVSPKNDELNEFVVVPSFAPKDDIKGNVPLPKKKSDLAKVIDLPTREPRADLADMTEIGSLRIEILEGVLTRDTNATTKMDPYVICETQELRIRTKAQTRQEAGNQPKWWQFFELSSKTLDDELTLMVFDEDVQESDVIGGTIVPFSKICADEGFDEWVTINYKG